MRLTRQESHERTRAALLDAAREQIAQQGVAAASVRSIAQAAGFTQGALYSCFESKEALLLALLDDHATRQTESLRAIVEAGPRDGEETLGAIGAWLAALECDPLWPGLGVELQLHASRNPDFAARYGESKASNQAALARVIATHFDRLGKVPALSPSELSAGLYAMWMGFGVAGAPKGIAPADVVLAFLRAAIETARPKTKKR